MSSLGNVIFSAFLREIAAQSFYYFVAVTLVRHVYIRLTDECSFAVILQRIQDEWLKWYRQKYVKQNGALTVPLRKEYRIVGEMSNLILYWTKVKYENLGFSRMLHGVFYIEK